MKIIIPMAGKGTRLRPHTLTIPKPLLPIAGKPMVQWIAEDIVKVCGEPVDEIAFIVGRFGEEAEKRLVSVAEALGAKGTIRYQDDPQGTAHAILCAADVLRGKIVVAFADTLFKASFTLDHSKDAIIWVQAIKDPSQFGVVKVNADGVITGFVEKPKEFVSNLAIIGIYYFRDGENLKQELQYLIDNNVIRGKEYQLTDALENMKSKGLQFVPGAVDEWLDCGNKDATVFTNSRVLELQMPDSVIPHDAVLNHTKIVNPVFLGNGVKIQNSTIGPNVSVGDNTTIENSVIDNSLIQSGSRITNAKLTNSMIGNHAIYDGSATQISIGDYSALVNTKQ